MTGSILNWENIVMHNIGTFKKKPVIWGVCVSTRLDFRYGQPCSLLQGRSSSYMVSVTFLTKLLPYPILFPRLPLFDSYIKFNLFCMQNPILLILSYTLLLWNRKKIIKKKSRRFFFLEILFFLTAVWVGVNMQVSDNIHLVPLWFPSVIRYI